MDNFWVNVTTSVVVLGLMIAYQPYWDLALFNYSLTEIPVIQAQLSPATINWWIWWAHWGLNGATYGPTIVAFAFGLKQRPRACCYAIY